MKDYYRKYTSLNDDEKFEKAKTLTKEEFLAETNADDRGAYYEIIGDVRMMEILGAEVVDESNIVHKDGSIETISLLKREFIPFYPCIPELKLFLLFPANCFFAITISFCVSFLLGSFSTNIFFFVNGSSSV